MSAAAPASTQGARRTLYHSPRGLYGFQADGTARVYADPLRAKLAIWSTGIGKTHLGMASAALLFEDDLVDLVITVCESNKLGEWVDDWRSFTDLSVERYHGDVKKRAKLRTNLPQVIVSTYETIKNDICVFHRENRRGRSQANTRKTPMPGPLLETISGKRVFLIYDEASAKLSGRGSGTYAAHDYLISQKRREGAEFCRVLGLTANLMEKDPASTFNCARILRHQPPCTVAQFEEDHVAEKNDFGDYIRFKNLTVADCESGVVPFTKKLGSFVMVKLKSEPDVRDFFPKKVEESLHVTLGERHLEFYDTVEALFEELPEDDADRRIGFNLLRQITNHPMSLLRSQGKYARAIVDTIGAQGLAALGSQKTDDVVEYVTRRVLKAGEQVVLFTFFGQSVLPLLHDEFRAHKVPVSINHGQMSVDARERSRKAFRAGDTGLFLTSDAGSRGLNLPEALLVMSYEPPTTWSNYDQRFNRIHRIDSTHDSVTAITVIADGTVDEGAANVTLRRNETEESMVADWVTRTTLDDEDDTAHMPASVRRLMLGVERKRKKKR